MKLRCIKLPFYDELRAEKISKVFKRYARSYTIKIIDSKDPSVQLTASKSSIKVFFKGILNEVKGFKYEIKVKVLLRKYKEHKDTEFVFVYFSFTNRRLINSEYDLHIFSENFI